MTAWRTTDHVNSSNSSRRETQIWKRRVRWGGALNAINERRRRSDEVGLLFPPMSGQWPVV